MEKEFYPKVSIIIPVYNGSNYIKDAIDSALSQTYKNIEILVINDGSKDNGETEKICKAYGNKIKYYYKKNGGVATALNKGIEMMQGEYFSWLSHDDLYLPFKVEKEIEALSNLEDKKTVIFSNFSEIDARGEKLRDVNLPSDASEFPRVFLSIETEQYLQGCTFLINKSLFYKNGIFDNTKKCTQDYYMWFNLASKSEFYHVKEVLVKTRIHEEQDSFSKAEIKREESDFMRAEFISQISAEELYGYTKGHLKPYWSLYYLYKKAGYTKFPYALVNKMHDVFQTGIDVSVIVPVFNVENYLSQCLDSLVEQTLMNIQIIIIDDGTEDSSGDIADSYANNCPSFIQVHHKKNGGLGSARNFGLKYAKGTYVGFVDSDDYVHKDMFRLLLKKALNGYDITISDFSAINNFDNSIAWVWESSDSFDYLSIREIIMRSTLELPPSAWNKLFKRDLLYKIPWGDGFYEDLQATPTYISYSEKIGFVHKPLYFYRINRRGSIMSTRRDDRRCLSFLDAWKNLLQNANPYYQKEVIFAVYVHFIDIIKAFPVFIDEFMAFFEEKKDLFLSNEYIKKEIKNDKILDLFNIKFLPKKIHYIWFGPGKLSDLNEKCIASWKRYAPEFEIKKWDETNCDVNENKYVQEAYKKKKWAFVADYFRFKILNSEGGIYVDTDIEFNARIDRLRLNRCFFAFEKKNIVNAGIFGSVSNNSILIKILNSYQKESFLDSEGNCKVSFPLPQRITRILIENYDLKPNGEKQTLENDITVYPINELTIDCNDGNNLVEHHYDYTWSENEPDIPYKYYVTKEYFAEKFLNENQNLNKDLLDLQNKYESLMNEKRMLESSLSWRFTTPFRNISLALKNFKNMSPVLDIRIAIFRFRQKLIK